jgi:hypothetical protein
MDFDKGAVKGDVVNVIREYSLLLESLEHPGKNTRFNPTPHPVVNSVPMAKLFG